MTSSGVENRNILVFPTSHSFRLNRVQVSVGSHGWVLALGDRFGGEEGVRLLPRVRPLVSGETIGDVLAHRCFTRRTLRRICRREVLRDTFAGALTLRIERHRECFS